MQFCKAKERWSINLLYATYNEYWQEEAMTTDRLELLDDDFLKAKIRFILDKYFIDNPLEPDDTDIDMAITDLAILSTAHTDTILEDLAKGLPEMWLADPKYRNLAADKDHGTDYFRALGHDEAIEACRSYIESSLGGGFTPTTPSTEGDK